MPQFDFTFAISQVFWLFITWAPVFLCIKYYTWPRIQTRQQNREEEKQKWIELTIQRQAEIDAWNDRYKRTLENAKREERQNMQDKLGKVEKNLEQQRAEFLERIKAEPVDIQTADYSDIKNSLKTWDKECWNNLPFSSH